MISVSVIMPIYNEQDYLGKALDSWVNQTLTGKELICIDDGSSDHSVDIVNEYCAKYPDIKLLRQNRKGAGAARNLGMEIARGQYICFLDADDFYIDDNALERMYRAAESEKVHVCAGYRQVYSAQGIIKDPVIRSLVCDGERTKIQYTDFQFDYDYQCYLFDRDFLNNLHIRFPLFKRFQDPPFLVQALYFAKEFLVVPVEFYGYRGGHKTIQFTNEKTYDLFQGLYFDLQFAEKYDLYDLLKLTVSRMNRDYFTVLYEGLISDNKPLLKLMLDADQTVEKFGYKLDALEALFLMKEMSPTFICSYGDYVFLRKIYEAIPQNSKVVIYGAGKIGTHCYEIISKNEKYKLCGWIDHYKAGMVYKGQRLEDIQAIEKIEYDYIMIAIGDIKISNDVKDSLESYGVNREHILQWSCS